MMERETENRFFMAFLPGRFLMVASILIISACSDNSTNSGGQASHSNNNGFTLAFEMESAPGTDSVSMSWSQVGFSPDGKIVAQSGRGQHVFIFSPDNGDLLLEVPTNSVGLGAVTAFSPNGDRLLVGPIGEKKPMVVFDASTGEVIASLDGQNKVRSAAFSPDGKSIVMGGEDGKVRIWNVGDGNLVKTLAGHGALVPSVRYSADGKLIATTGFDWTARIWGAQSGELLNTLEHPSHVHSAKFSEDGDKLLTASMAETIHAWGINDGELISVLEMSSGSTVNFADFGGSENYIIGVDNLGNLIVWDVSSAGMHFEVKTVSDSIGVFDRPNESLIAFGRRAEWRLAESQLETPEGVNRNDEDVIIDLHSKETVQVLNQDGFNMDMAEFDRTGTRLVTLESSGSHDIMRVWVR